MKQQKAAMEHVNHKAHGMGMGAVDVEADTSEPLLKVAQMQESPTNVLSYPNSNTLVRAGHRVSTVTGPAAS